MKLKSLVLAASLASASGYVAAKLPPPPPVDPAVAAAKAEKDKATADKAKADLARYEDKSVANFQKNMKKAGKPVPKPTPIVVAAAPAPGSLEGFGSTLWFVASFSNEFLGNGPGDETVWRREPATADCRRVRCGAHAPLSTACQPGRVALALQLTGRRNMRTNTLARHTQGPCASPTRSAAAAFTG